MGGVVNDSADYQTYITGSLYKIAPVIGHMYKICLLTMTTFYAILKLDLAGSGAARSAASNKSWLGGETQKRPATLAVSVCHRLASGYRGPEGPEV
jgi:hypothetical protein